MSKAVEVFKPVVITEAFSEDLKGQKMYFDPEVEMYVYRSEEEDIGKDTFNYRKVVFALDPYMVNDYKKEGLLVDEVIVEAENDDPDVPAECACGGPEVDLASLLDRVIRIEDKLNSLFSAEVPKSSEPKKAKK